MRQDEMAMQEENPARARIVTVAGLKKSGKTAVAEALIRELGSRGLRVGSVKTIRHHPLGLERTGTDTRRHIAAGAEFTVALLDGELAYFEPHSARPGLREAARLFRPGVEYVVWEGMADPQAGGCQVVCLEEMSDLDRTLAERQIPTSAILAISGVAAGRSAAGSAAGDAGGIPVVDATLPAGAAALADLVLRWFGEGRR